jgi:hypothetical protein
MHDVHAREVDGGPVGTDGVRGDSNRVPHGCAHSVANSNTDGRAFRAADRRAHHVPHKAADSTADGTADGAADCHSHGQSNRVANRVANRIADPRPNTGHREGRSRNNYQRWNGSADGCCDGSLAI